MTVVIYIFFSTICRCIISNIFLCIMNLRVTVFGKVKGHETCSRSESESEEGVKSDAVDAKPSDLPLARMKSG